MFYSTNPTQSSPYQPHDSPSLYNTYIIYLNVYQTMCVVYNFLILLLLLHSVLFSPVFRSSMLRFHNSISCQNTNSEKYIESVTCEMIMLNGSGIRKFISNKIAINTLSVGFRLIASVFIVYWYKGTAWKKENLEIENWLHTYTSIWSIRSRFFWGGVWIFDETENCFGASVVASSIFDGIT